MKLEPVVLGLIRDALSRCGSGWGKFPWGMLHAIDRLLPLVDGNYYERNGYGEPCATITESVNQLRKKLEA